MWLKLRPPLGVFLCAMLLAGCARSPLPTTPTETALSPPPTPNLGPLAAVVNGEAIILPFYEAELARYEAAQQLLGTNLATPDQYREAVLQSLIDQRLLAQGAQAQAIDVGEEAIAQKITELAEALGGQEALEAWLQANAYSQESFRQALQVELLAAAMVEILTEAVPSTDLHVHARHILVRSLEDAEAVLDKLRGGADFANQAAKNSLDRSTRQAGGDLGWFSRGALTVPELEEAAFALEPGELSEVIETDLGYHVVQTLEKAERTLSWDVLQARRRQAVETWLLAQRDVARIEIYVVAQP